jgi:AcrR family transcriptional regulator
VAIQGAPARRLSKAQRRQQLVDIGVELVASSTFEDVSIDHVAVEAGISRSLLFHYFPTKREFQVAVAEAAADDLLRATEPDDSLPLEQRLQDSLDRFVSYVASRGPAFISLVRGASGGDAALQAVFDRAHDVVARRVLDGLEMTEADATPLVQIALRGWVAFIEECVVVWLSQGGAAREELVVVLQQALVAALGAADPALEDPFGPPSPPGE